MIINGPLSNLSIEELDSIIQRYQAETNTLEYKQKPSDKLQQREEKKEFLADVSSLANTAGGEIIYGVQEENGAFNLLGFNCDSIDNIKLQMQQIIHDGIIPKIQGFHLDHKLLSENKYILYLRIPMSYNRPHVIWFDRTSKFWGRNVSGKYQIDYSGIKELFLGNQRIEEKLRSFVLERISDVKSNQTQFQIEKTPSLLLHAIPLESFELPAKVDLVGNESALNELAPLESYGYSHLYNYDGFATFFKNDTTLYAYNQYFHNGAMELFTQIISDNNVINIRNIEGYVFAGIRIINKAMALLKMECPLLISASLINLNGYKLSLMQHLHYPTAEAHREDYIFSPILVHNMDREPNEIMKPVFDRLWNIIGIKEYSH